MRFVPLISAQTHVISEYLLRIFFSISSQSIFPLYSPTYTFCFLIKLYNSLEVCITLPSIVMFQINIDNITTINKNDANEIPNIFMYLIFFILFIFPISETFLISILYFSHFSVSLAKYFLFIRKVASLFEILISLYSNSLNFNNLFIS